MIGKLIIMGNKVLNKSHNVFALKPNHATLHPLDGVATQRHSDMVFKIPDGGRVRILPGGNVSIINHGVTGTKANLNSLYSVLRYGQPYRYGWLDKAYFQSIGAYDNSKWSLLFQRAGR